MALARARARRDGRRALGRLVGPGNVQHNLELEQLSTGGNRIGAFAGVGCDRRPGRPGLEGVLGLPLGDNEVAVLAFDRAEQLESQKSGLTVDGVRAVGEPLLKLRTGAGGHLDCIDLDHGHGPKATAPPSASDTAQDRSVSSPPLIHRGGSGRPIVLVHGLMGRGSTWSRQVPWLTRYGSVYTYDAPWHRGCDVDDSEPISTERFVEQLGGFVEQLGRPAVLIGHSMGGLHSWCLAAERPEVVSALVVEDMAPDFVGGTTGAWEPWLHALPQEFRSAEAVFAEFGDIAGRYFLEAFDRTPTGWRLHGKPAKWIDIAAQWGLRDFWAQWRAVRVPVLLIEAGDTVTPAGQMQRMAQTAGAPAHYVRVAGAGHLIHDAAPEAYRAAVEEFLGGLND